MATAEVAAENNSEKFAPKRNSCKQPTTTATIARLKLQAKVFERVRLEGVGVGGAALVAAAGCWLQRMPDAILHLCTNMADIGVGCATIARLFIA